MHLVDWFSATALRRLLAVAAVAATLPAAARADLVHKYTFNGNNAADSVGGLDGVIVDNTGVASFTGGALDLTANEGANSGQDFALPTTVGAFVDLPNSIFSNAVQNSDGTGEYGQATLEMWLTPQQNRNWAEGFVFGTSVGGENIANGGATYVAYIPQSGENDNRATTRTAGPPVVEAPIPNGPPLAVNQKHHVVLVLNQGDPGSGGTNFNGTATLYLNNGAPVDAAIEPLIDTMANDNNWLGRSLFGGDPLFDGLIDEFRIYNHALSAGEVAGNFTTGPDAASTPVLVVDRDTGAISLTNESAGAIQVKGYSITSAGGALNTAGWTSIDAGNLFDPDGTWTTQSLTNTNIAESVTSGEATGGAIAPDGSRGIGSPWFVSPIEDLVFTYTLGNGATAEGQIVYAGSAPPRSDFNGNGDVDVADWALFLPNSFTAFPAELDVAAYLKGDLDGDNDNDLADFRLFKADFIAANGEAAFAALGATVPEPSSLALVVVSALAIAAVRRRPGAV